MFMSVFARIHKKIRDMVNLVSEQKSKYIIKYVLQYVYAYA